MSMSVSFHLNTAEKIRVDGYATENSYKHQYAVFNVTAESGYMSQEVSFFLNMENIKAMKHQLAKAERELKKLEEKEVNA